MASETLVTTRDAGLCRDHLTSLLTEEASTLTELENLLMREHEVLGERNVAAIERTALLRQQLMGTLARTEEQRRALCCLHGYSADWVGLEELMRWCDPAGSLMPRLRECAQRGVRCRDLNDRNGILVSAQLQHVARRLATLTGGANPPATYGPKGAAPLLHPKRDLGAA
jgi:flagellar biosynthesis/type III secretory pathway chaperone